ncbi:NAD-dependent epimerase/dehydratase family protein [Iocasia frigidifontis]|uniref:NAD-dependent epimerase/dehydratase family protein n=1 Tax=Iocasia fonsfrigidae TaxID=2682810 RepID=A0A8A7KE32_9FIRM|nr:polysaccharide biosynthesis protein [Iocasia fonsfrigidae]QTL97689.1 NAD-dependent epimerase/dehydratase family protein [Iocasia fonsfrigidae]
MFEGKNILITGGTGSWGNELVSQLLEKNPTNITIYSRNEYLQVEMTRKFNSSKLKFIIGDIRDYNALKKATKNIDYIFHLAALKHVPICEKQPFEAIATNIMGVENLIKAAIKNKVYKVIDVSTDKAVMPINVYGMTKSLGERLIIRANLLSSDTRFICIRAGNILGTNGSVIPYFINQVKTSGVITITDPHMTRFFLTLEDAISLLFKTSESSIGGETFVMKMAGFKILNIAKVIKNELGDNNSSIKIVGKRPGEKIHEVLISKYEVENTYNYDKEYFIIFPQLNIPKINQYYNKEKMPLINQKEYSSNDLILGYEETRDILYKGGFV